ncbi:hypothetical protein Pla123a_07580 [Posidoniimonas polymericola]|uniref:Carboxypeptidase regulatory-like domain-containing protein n=1 Tax=Posidoniimonas polymericola TaxID=2528002 RepID=A0A5C5ZGE4_9BACT|nr:hypothetical protein [Posidoniimonas polymericola]TWT85951.1 hypothetical protein Pla123a_07580 [Posidoniimonas polymericola]
MIKNSHSYCRVFPLLLIAAAGCSESGEYTPVSGTVYFDDQPLSSGVVMFQPPTGPMARSNIAADGGYSLQTLGEADGVRTGVSKVRVSARAASDGGSGEVGLGRLLVPERYTDFDQSGLTVDVSLDNPGPYDLRLTSNRDPSR